MAEEARIGQGFDVHQFEDGDGVILCGVKIPCAFKLKGHSDADVAWHALTDAILGAIGCGDIGEYFPPSNDKWKGADSAIFLKYAGALAFEQNYKINNVDITIICEEPKLSAYKKDMASKTAEILRITPNRVNIKGTTTEKLGFTGRGEGIAALAVILLS